MTPREIRSNCGNPQSPALHTSLLNKSAVFLDFSNVMGNPQVILRSWYANRKLESHCPVTRLTRTHAVGLAQSKPVTLKGVSLRLCKSSK